MPHAPLSASPGETPSDAPMRFTPLAGTAAGNDFVAGLLSPVTAVAVALGAISTGRGWWCAMRKALRPPRAARQRTA